MLIPIRYFTTHEDFEGKKKTLGKRVRTYARIFQQSYHSVDAKTRFLASLIYGLNNKLRSLQLF